MGGTAGFTDKHLSERIGTIFRLNAKTACLCCCQGTDGHWRVALLVDMSSEVTHPSSRLRAKIVRSEMIVPRVLLLKQLYI